MARGIKNIARKSPAPKAGRPTAKPAKTAAKAPASKPVAAKTSVPPVPMVSKGALRVQVEKLEQTVATLRTKGREATRAAKTAAARIAELEGEVATLQKQVASQAATTKRSVKKPAARERSIDPGDAVPPGVAVADPEPIDGEAETVLENLQKHLGESDEADATTG